MTALRQTAGDRRFAGSQLTVAIGPVALPHGANGVRERLEAIARQGRHTRVGLIPDPESARWEYDVARAVAVRECSQNGVDDLGAAIERASHTAVAPIDIMIIGDHLIATVDHAIGDGVIVTDLVPALTRSTTEPFPSHLTAGYSVSRHPSALALASAIRHRPVETARSLRAVSRPSRAAATTHTVLAPHATTRTVVVDSTSGMPDRLRRFRDDRFPGATATATLSWLIDRNLRSVGIRTAADLTMMANLRRHLPHGKVCAGNFVGAVTAPTSSPEDMTRAVQATVSSPDLVVRQALSDALNATRPGRMRDPHRKRAVHGSPVRLIVSDMSISPAVPTTHWDDASSTPRFFVAATQCSRSDELNLAYTRVDDRLFVTARFFDGSHDVDVIASAIRCALLEPAEAL